MEIGMQMLVEELATVVCQEIDHYRQLLGLVRRERGRIVRGQLAGLVEVTRQKEALTSTLTQLERSRSSLLARLAPELGHEAGAVTLGRAAALLHGECGETFRALVAEFRVVVGQLVAAHDVNRTLLDRSLALVQGSLEIFRPVVDGPPAYGAGGLFNGAAHPVAALNQTV
jgi:flagellar biosynthesis/type III secretory pathway chaperone